MTLFRDDTTPRRSSKIEWTEHTWNPTVGCSLASPGCTNCYAMRAAHRIAGRGLSPAYAGLTESVNGNPVWTGRVAQASPASVGKPLGIRQPSIFFVNSMSDLFHPDMADAWQVAAFEVMVKADRHQYQILTKRPEVAGRFLARHPQFANLPHVWLGVSVEDGRRKWRIDVLRELPAAIRFLSVEPLIGPVGGMNLAGIDWVITGGESGPGARPCDPDWVREVAAECARAGVPLFHKQWGTWASNPLAAEHGVEGAKARDLDPGAKGGATLDGRLYREMPRGIRAVAS